MRFISCCNCGGHVDTLVKVEDGKYRHQSKLSCQAERRRQEAAKAVLPKSEILPARRPLVLPNLGFPRR